MPQTDHDRAIALAGLLQAVDLVRAIARYGHANEENLEACLTSLFQINAPSSAEVFGGIPRLQTGLQLLIKHLLNPQDTELTRYVIALMVLERKLIKRHQFVERIREGIQINTPKLQEIPLTDATIIANLADLYSSTISRLTPRIIVPGEPAYLSQPRNANCIRALLLSGIRAAMLWRQSGGNRLTLLLRRKALLQEARQLLGN